MSFKKGSSFIRVSSNDDHILSNALKEKGYDDFELIFAGKFSPDFGWTVIKGFLLPTWLGYNKRHALQSIEKLNSFIRELEIFYKDIVEPLKWECFIRESNNKIVLIDSSHKIIKSISNKDFDIMIKYDLIKTNSYAGSQNQYYYLNK